MLTLLAWDIIQAQSSSNSHLILFYQFQLRGQLCIYPHNEKYHLLLVTHIMKVGGLEAWFQLILLTLGSIAKYKDNSLT